LEECGAGDSDAASARLASLAGLPILELTPAAEALATTLMREVPLPDRAATDSLHVALAAVKGVEYLVTWNCAHIANAVLRPRIEAACRRAGYEHRR
jgi:hypothetical protein